MATFYTPGRYLGRISSQAMGQSKNGNPQFVLTVVVLGKINTENPEGPLLAVGEQYERTIYLVITDKTIDYVVEDLGRIGFTGDKFEQLDPSTSGYQNFTGQEITVSCEHETYEGKEREKWRIARDSGAAQVKPLDPKGLRQLDAMFGKQLKTLAKGRQPAATASTAPANGNAPARELERQTVPPEAVDDDVPF